MRVLQSIAGFPIVVGAAADTECKRVYVLSNCFPIYFYYIKYARWIFNVSLLKCLVLEQSQQTWSVDMFEIKRFKLKQATTKASQVKAEAVLPSMKSVCNGCHITSGRFTVLNELRICYTCKTAYYSCWRLMIFKIRNSADLTTVVQVAEVLSSLVLEQTACKLLSEFLRFGNLTDFRKCECKPCQFKRLVVSLNYIPQFKISQATCPNSADPQNANRNPVLSSATTEDYDRILQIILLKIYIDQNVIIKCFQKNIKILTAAQSMLLKFEVENDTKTDRSLWHKRLNEAITENIKEHAIRADDNKINGRGGEIEKLSLLKQRRLQDLFFKTYDNVSKIFHVLNSPTNAGENCFTDILRLAQTSFPSKSVPCPFSKLPIADRRPRGSY